MRKLFVILVIVAFLFAFQVSAAKNNDDTGNGGNAGVQASVTSNKTTAAGESGNPSETTRLSNSSRGSEVAQENKNESAGQGIGVSGNLTTLKNQEEIKTRIRLIENESAQLSGSGMNNELKNQNTVRAAVQALVAAGNLSGGIGEQISAIAQEFNNSVTLQYSAEKRIQDRNAVSRFFFGGDSDAAGEIQQQIETNRERIESLNTLMNECDCDDELRAMIREQIQLLEEEQNRLQELSQAELDDKGLLGGLLG